MRSLSAIELSLRRTINHRFNAKIHFLTRPNPTPLSPAHHSTPLAKVMEEDQESVLEQFTPAKLGGKEMKGLSTASKIGKES